MTFICLIIFFSLFIFIQMKMPSWKGKFSENLVYNEMLRLPDEYIIFNDLLFKSNEHSTQIDHLVVSPYGVFVIETKGYKGWIFGGENSEYWTQVIYKSKHQFYNPIKQNNGHVRFLRYLLKNHFDIPLIPIVVFNNSADLKVNVNNHIVVNRNNLIQAISQYHEIILDANQIEWIVDTILQQHTIANKEEAKQHKYNVQNRQYRTQNLIRQGICPQCGGQLILRHGKYGSFYGCSTYPKCKFSINKQQ